MDDLKVRIWDYLFRLGRPQPIAIIAEQLNETPHTIRQVVDDPWFNEQDGMIGIARTR